MRREPLLCISCNEDISATGKGVRFKCPNCGKEIVRCENCRKLMVRYRCECGFEGP